MQLLYHVKAMTAEITRHQGNAPKLIPVQTREISRGSSEEVRVTSSKLKGTVGEGVWEEAGEKPIRREEEYLGGWCSNLGGK